MTDRSAELERLLGADRLARPLYPLASDGTAGRRDPSPTWDPWFCLPLTQRRRLLRFMAPTGEGISLDDMADMVGAGSLDDALQRWARACLMARKGADGWELTRDEVSDWAESDAQLEADSELYGPQELAWRWGISVPALHQRRHRGKTPEPDLVISQVPIWTGETVRVWEERVA